MMYRKCNTDGIYLFQKSMANLLILDVNFDLFVYWAPNLEKYKYYQIARDGQYKYLAHVINTY